jgi:hypothetical protein
VPGAQRGQRGARCRAVWHAWPAPLPPTAPPPSSLLHARPPLPRRTPRPRASRSARGTRRGPPRGPCPPAAPPRAPPPRRRRWRRRRCPPSRRWPRWGCAGVAGRGPQESAASSGARARARARACVRLPSAAPRTAARPRPPRARRERDTALTCEAPRGRWRSAPPGSPACWPRSRAQRVTRGQTCRAGPLERVAVGGGSRVWPAVPAARRLHPRARRPPAGLHRPALAPRRGAPRDARMRAPGGFTVEQLTLGAALCCGGTAGPWRDRRRPARSGRGDALTAALQQLLGILQLLQGEGRRGRGGQLIERGCPGLEPRGRRGRATRAGQAQRAACRGRRCCSPAAGAAATIAPRTRVRRSRRFLGSGALVPKLL